MKFLLAFIMFSIAYYSLADEGIDIVDPVQIYILNELQNELDSVTEAIMECINGGMDHLACMCRQKEKILQFNASANQLFSSHPEFRQFDLVRFRSPDGQYVSQSLEGIRKQASIEPSCD